MSTHTVGPYVGKCSKCGRVYHSAHAEMVVCSCFEVCPLCGQRMVDYVPDLAPSEYGRGGVRELAVLKVCNNAAGHSDNAPFFSTQRPVEVELERE